MSAPAQSKPDFSRLDTESEYPYPTAADSPQELAIDASSHQNIEQLAYALWQSHGCQQGAADRDWVEAEEQLRTAAFESSGLIRS